MKLNKTINMKDMLAQSLYSLMEEKSFDKITIKEISAKTGVIRGTFYNHFYDKHEAFEYLSYLILLEKNKDIYDYSQFFKNILYKIDEEKDFFMKCFQFEGQNGFKYILTKVFTQLLAEYLKIKNVDFLKTNIDEKLFVEINVNSIVFIIENWMIRQNDKSAEEIYELFEFIFTNSTKDIISKLSKTQ